MTSRWTPVRTFDSAPSAWTRLAPIRKRALHPADRAEGQIFMVLAGGRCIPVDGSLRVEEIDGDFYVLGNSSWERCDCRDSAHRRLAQRIRELDPHDLVAGAIASLEP